MRAQLSVPPAHFPSHTVTQVKHTQHIGFCRLFVDGATERQSRQLRRLFVRPRIGAVSRLDRVTAAVGMAAPRTTGTSLVPPHAGASGPASPLPKLSLQVLHDVVRQLWGAEPDQTPPPPTGNLDAATGTTVVPWLRTRSMLRDDFRDALAGTDPRDWIAQSRVEGCECMVILMRLQDAPVIVLLPVDPRLQLSAENYIHILRVPHTMWRGAAPMFNGTLVCAVRTAERALILYDVAVTCGFTLVGSGAPKAPFTKRMGILTEIANNLRSLLTTEGWSILEAPWTLCGANQALAVYESVKPRGIFFLHNAWEVEAPRMVWSHHTHINMSLCGATWFVGGKDGAISSVLPNVRVDVDEAAFGAVGDMVPMSLGRFVPQVEHAEASKGLAYCQRWLTLHEIESAVQFRNFDLPHWECVRFFCDTKDTVMAKFAALPHQLAWETEVRPFIMGGVVASPSAWPCRGCVFAATNEANTEGVEQVAHRRFENGRQKAQRKAQTPPRAGAVLCERRAKRRRRDSSTTTATTVDGDDALDVQAHSSNASPAVGAADRLCSPTSRGRAHSPPRHRTRVSRTTWEHR